jgi:hypothetical protein
MHQQTPEQYIIIILDNAPFINRKKTSIFLITIFYKFLPQRTFEEVSIAVFLNRQH